MLQYKQEPVGDFMAKGLSFSYSKMGMYKECPQKYKFRYVHMLPEQPKYYFAFGTALHAVMEYIYDPKTPQFPTLAQALAFFKKHWDATSFEEKGYASMEKESLGFEEGARIIRAYYEKYGNVFVHPLSVEMKSTMDMDGLSLTSILDRIDYLGNGHIKILDYKTGKTVQREPDQLMMYQKVAESSPMVLKLVQSLDPAVTNVRVEQLSFYHLPSLQELSFPRCEESEMDAFWQRVLGIADNIRAAKFSPTPDENKCRWCDYRNICPVFTGKEYDGPSGWGAKNPVLSSKPSVESASPANRLSTAIPQTDSERIAAKIDRLGLLIQEEQKLREEILHEMKDLNFKRHFGEKFRAQLITQKQTKISHPEKMVALLRQLGLLGKTLTPTKSKIVDLLQDISVPEDIRKQLHTLIEEKSFEQIEITKVD